MTDKTSWVYTTLPPGWGETCERGDVWYVRRGERPTRELACRRAWERWALEVLGPVTWQYGLERAPELGVPRSRYVTARGDRCWAHGSRRHYTTVYESVYDDEAVSAPTCTDPVEALARLAALVLAVEGPG
jgi:hypothetical protein